MGGVSNMYFLEQVRKLDYMEVVRLLNKGETPNINWLTVTPLQLAVEKGDINMLALLLDWHADPAYKPNGGKNALAVAEAQLLDKSKAGLKDVTEMALK